MILKHGSDRLSGSRVVTVVSYNAIFADPIKAISNPCTVINIPDLEAVINYLICVDCLI